MRFLAVDLGDKRTGLAVGDSITGLVSPLAVVQAPVGLRGGEELLAALERAVEEQLGPRAEFQRGGAKGELVVGLPLNMDGTEGPRARMVREFAARLSERTGRVVHLQDERLSSAAADWSMAGTGMTHKQKKERRDALAAAAVLRDFLERRAAGEGEAG